MKKNYKDEGKCGEEENYRDERYNSNEENYRDEKKQRKILNLFKPQ
ncbi:MAG: hypothetical protein LC102_09885 [Ignavibacteriales bacterium]|nr:hypothetical protein [Ignavibacteria bacterium]MBZ0195758.1 hypothetical protein [Ignavibacteriaceae bacterium]MCZ2143723.1 hypothetical protein [Ignavibacteriales bacterium]WKZ73682.1 MAG: hypothetical protein QY308_05620 [Ignavibacteriaceae bacterium]